MNKLAPSYWKCMQTRKWSAQTTQDVDVPILRFQLVGVNMVLRWSSHLGEMDLERVEEGEGLALSLGSKHDKSNSSWLMERMLTGKMEKNMVNIDLDKLWLKYLISYHLVEMTYNNLLSRFIFTRICRNIWLNISKESTTNWRYPERFSDHCYMGQESEQCTDH